MAETEPTGAVVSMTGRFRVMSADGRDITPRGHKARALLAILTTSAGTSECRSRLRDMLWSDRGERESAMSLRQSLSEIRRAFGASRQILETHGEQVRFHVRRVDAAPEQGAILEDVAVRDPVFLDWLDALRADPPELMSGDRPPEPSKASQRIGEAPLPVHGVPLPLGTAPLLVVHLPDCAGADLAGIAYAIASDMTQEAGTLRWLAVSAPYLASGHRTDGYALNSHLSAHESSHGLTTTLTGSDGTLIWTHAFACRWDDEDARRECVRVAIGNVSEAIARCEEERACVEDHRTVRGMVWRSSWHLNNACSAEIGKAVKVLARAREHAPRHREVVVQDAVLAAFRFWGTRGDPQDGRRAMAIAQHAVSVAPDDARAHWSVASIANLSRQRERACLAAMEATERSPSFAYGWTQLASNMMMEGRPEGAIEPANRALERARTSRREFFFHGELTLAHWLAGDHEQAAFYGEKAIRQKPQYWYAHVALIAALHESGRIEATDEARDRLFALRPQMGAHDVEWLPFEDPNVVARMLDALRLHPSASDAIQIASANPPGMKVSSPVA